MGKKSKRLTIDQYIEAKLNDGLVYSAITKRCRENRALPNVRKFEKFGDVWILHVAAE